MPKPNFTNERPSFVSMLALFAAFGLLEGCSSVQGFLPHGEPNAPAIALGPIPPKTARPAANPSEKPIVRPITTVDINCPTVDVAEGGAAYRVGGEDNASVRYQFNIADTARECDPAGPGQASIKVGVKGEVVVGPAGSAGTYSIPLKIAVIREGEKNPVYSKSFKVEATTDGVTAGAFQLVTEPILVPMPTLQLADIYTLSVGFEGGGAGAAPKRHHRRHPSG
jgi:hypothetical protein